MEFWHVVYVSLKDKQPQISWAVYNTADEAYVAAAYALKRSDEPLGYFIGWNMGVDDHGVVETYLPLGGPHRFDMKRVGKKFELFFDDECLTCVGEEV